MKHIATVSSYLFGDHIIISFSKDWLNSSGKLPVFDVYITDKHLQLISKEKMLESKRES